MKVALISFHFAQYSLLLASALSNLNNEVLLVLNKDNFINEFGNISSKNFHSPLLSINMLPHKKNLYCVLANSISIIKMVYQFKPDIIHLQEDTKDYLMFAIPALLKWPIVLTVHDPTPHSGRDSRIYKFSRHRLYTFFLRRCCKSAIVHGRFLVDDLEKVAPHLKKKIDVIMHGPLPFQLKQNQSNIEKGRLLFFGRIHKYKGLGDFISAIEILKNNGAKVRGVIAGQGTDLQKYLGKIAAVGDIEVINRYILATEVDSLFNRADIIVLPYKDATQSGVIAMAFGFQKPVVATRVGSIPEIVQNMKTGLLVEPNNPIELANAIEKLLNDRELYNSIVRNINRMIHTTLSWNSIAKDTTHIYNDIINLKL